MSSNGLPNYACVNIDPMGSTNTILHFGFISFNYLAVPVIVPPVDAAHIN